jgi:hypothetical protein
MNEICVAMCTHVYTCYVTVNTQGGRAYRMKYIRQVQAMLSTSEMTSSPLKLDVSLNRFGTSE